MPKRFLVKLHRQGVTHFAKQGVNTDIMLHTLCGHRWMFCEDESKDGQKSQCIKCNSFAGLTTRKFNSRN